MKLKVISGICLLIAVLIYSCESESSIEFKRYYSAGSVVYQSHCQNCHGDKGQGLASLIPPFTDSTYLKTNKASLPCFIQHGLKGKIILAGKTFDGEMTAVDLSPIEIAQVLTYVGNSFGNKLGVVTGDDVGVELGKCK